MGKSSATVLLILISLCTDSTPFAFSHGSQHTVSCYVSPTGDDSNPGTESQPWKTIQKACNSALVGSTVFIKAGVYNEKVVMNVTGDALNGYITFTQFGNDTVIIDGTGKTGDQIILIQNKNYVKIVGLELRNNLNQSFGTGIWLQGYGDHIELWNNRIHDIRAAAGGGDAMGISVYGSSNIPLSHIIIDNNHIFDCQPGHSESLTLNGNVDTFQVTNNLVHDVDNIGIDMIGGEGTCPTPSKDAARNGVCRGNTVYHARSNYGGGYAAGIYVDGGINILLERNVVHECDVGMEIGCENHGKVASGMIVRENLFYNNDKRGLSFGGYNYPTTGHVTNSQFLNNTCYHNDILNTDAGELVIEYALNCIVKNNIFYGTSQNTLMTTSFPIDGNNSLDYNEWYLDAGPVNAKIDYNGTVYNSFGTYQTGTGQDANSIFANPNFVSAIVPSPDLHLQSSSLAINAGDPSFVPSGGETDFEGNPRISGSRVDIGAYEKALNLPAPPDLVAPLNGALLTSLTVLLQWTRSAGSTSYHLQVANDSIFTALAFNDSTLTDNSRQFGPILNGTKYFWRVRGRNADGAGTWSSAWHFTYVNPDRWEMISVHLKVADPRKSTLFPTAVSNAFAYDPSTGYVTQDSLKTGVGYWIKFGLDRTTNIAGDSILTDTIDVLEGWNLIGSISVPVAVSSIQSMPLGVITSNFFGYSVGYTIADTIKPTHGYWVKSRQNAQIILSK